MSAGLAAAGPSRASRRARMTEAGAVRCAKTPSRRATRAAKSHASASVEATAPMMQVAVNQFADEAAIKGESARPGQDPLVALGEVDSIRGSG